MYRNAYFSFLYNLQRKFLHVICIYIVSQRWPFESILHVMCDSSPKLCISFSPLVMLLVVCIWYWKSGWRILLKASGSLVNTYIFKGFFLNIQHILEVCDNYCTYSPQVVHWLSVGLPLQYFCPHQHKKRKLLRPILWNSREQSPALPYLTVFLLVDKHDHAIIWFSPN